MKCILAPVNFSQASDNAAFYAAELAKSLNRPLVLLHVMSIPLSIPPVPLPAEMFDSMRKDAMTNLGALANRLKELSGVDAQVEAELGSIGFQIETAINKFKPEVVVMGISKDSASRVIYSSNVFESLKQLRVPMLVIGEDVAFYPVKKIAVAVDVRNDEISVPVEALKNYCNLYNAKLDWVYVNKSGQTPPIDRFKALQNLLDNVDSDAVVVEDDDIENGLQQYIERHQTQQLVLLPQQHRFFEFHSSETKKLLWKFEIAVVILKES